jgi:VWFA-related protein
VFKRRRQGAATGGEGLLAALSFGAASHSARQGARRAILLLILGLAPLFAYAPENPRPQGVIRITVNLVQVDAVVTDSKRRQVTNLKPEDFEILEDGRPQTITNFSYISVAAPTRGETPAQPSALSIGVPVVSPTGLRPEQVRRTIAVVVDDLHLSFENTVYVRQALKKFVDEDVQPGDLVAILRTSSGLGVLQQFTNDKRVLYAAVERVRYSLAGGWGLESNRELGGSRSRPDAARLSEGSTRPPADEREGGRKDLEAAATREGDLRRHITTAGTLGTLDYVLRGLRDLPGRKSVVLLSDTIPVPPAQPGLVWQKMRELVDLANRSSAVLYAIDTRGLPTLQLSAADDLTGLGMEPPLVVASLPMNRWAEFFESQGVSAYLANQTGGIFVHDNNDLAGGMHTVMDDLSGYYLIGFKPPADTFKAGEKGGGYHRIQVKVKVPGLHVRSRSGFYGIPDEETRPVYRTRDEQLGAAATSPFGTSGVRVQLASQFVNEGRKDSLARLWLHIDAHDMTLQDAPGGSKKATLDLLALTFGDNGAVAAGLGRTFRSSILPSGLDALRKRGMNYSIDVPIKDGGYQLRVAVRDPISRRVGSASQFIEIPDLRRGRLTLSGIVLNPDTLGDKGPAVRRFQAGDRVSYELEIYNARRGKAGQAPSFETKIQILRDGHLVSTQNPGAIRQVPWDSRRLVMSGQLTLSPDMVPGDYALQVTVTDKLAPPQHSVASQRIDFEIMQ